MARAAGVVSTCDQTHLQTALNGGGLVIFTCSGTISITSTLSISANTMIDGTGQNVVLDGGGSVRILVVNSGATLTLNDLTIQNGNAGSNAGGGISNSGTLIVTNSTFSDNNAPHGDGGGIVTNGGAVTIVNSTFSGNSASSGGGIEINGGAVTIVNSTFSSNSTSGFAGAGIDTLAGTLIVTNSTFYGNHSPLGGGGIYSADTTLTVTNSTFFGNTGGGIYFFSLSSSATIRNSILVGNPSENCGSITGFIDGGYNLDDDGSCGFNATGSHSNDKTITFTSSSPQNNGGPTATLALASTATDAIGVIPPGVNGCASTVVADQRGVTRPGSVNGKCSMGAYEYVPAADYTISDCQDVNTILTDIGNGGRIVFACDGDIGLTTTISSNTMIDATGHTVTLDGRNEVGVLFVDPGVTLTINNLTIANGNSISGGGFVVQNGTLTVTNSTFSGNNASNGGGGGINEGGTLTITNSTFTGNSAGDSFGGGILNYSGTLTITNSTFTGNSAKAGGGIFGGATLENTIVAGNPNGGDCRGTITDGGYNLDDDGSCGFSATGSKSNNHHANLGSLSNNGGSTETIPLQTGSSALDAIPIGASGCGAIIADQRRVIRPQGPACDIGAYEANEIPVPFDTASPEGLSLVVGSTTYNSTPDVPYLVVGGQYTISAPSPQFANSTEYAFSSWSDSGAATHSITVSATDPMNYVATFNVTGYQLTTNANPSAGGLVNVLTSSNTGYSGYYTPSTVVSLSASANTGYLFSSWTGNVASPNNASTTVTMSQPQTVTANFVNAYTLTTSVSPAGTGMVTVGTPATNGYYATGTVVSISATPAPGYLFSGWTGSSDIANPNSASTTITMNANESITANFAVANSATFLPVDTSTQGNWVGVYGSDGFIIANDGANVTPSYATVNFTGSNTWTWGTGSDPRALLLSPSSTNRIASTFYSGTNFSIDLTLTGGLHEVALYLLDYDTAGRNETITILNGDTQAVLDTRSFSNFQNGVYAVWKLSGHVILQVANNRGLNAVVSGLFFSTPSLTPGPVVTIYSPTPNQTVTGTITLSANVTAQAGVQNVQFVLDGTTNLSPLIPGDGATYTYQWNSASVNNGPHTLKVVGTDNLSQTGSSIVSFMVSNPGAPAASATFMGPVDTTTQGNWVGKYGQDGFQIANDPSSAPPVYAAINFTGANTWTWNGSTGDPRALLSSPTGSTSTRIASTYYSNTSFTIDLNLTDNQAHLVALYLLDYDDGRSETITIVDANNPSNVLSPQQSASNFQNGQYYVWKIQGHVQIQVQTTGGLNGVVSGLFFATPGTGGQAPPAVTVTAPTANQQISGQFTVQATATSTGSVASVQFYVDNNAVGPAITQGVNSTYSYTLDTTTLTNSTHTIKAVATDNLNLQTTSSPVSFTVSNVAATKNSAVFVRTDTTTQGSWKGVYGGAGEIIANDSNNPPSYAVVSFPGASLYTWAYTSDPRALLEANSTNNRIASTYYASPGFSIDVNFTDGNTHQVALYLLDWDYEGRAETINILDASNTSNVLSTQSASGFANGVYYVYNISGHVIIQVNQTAGQNAVVSGLFFQ